MIKMKRGIYLLPSLFTTASLALGILSIINSINAKFTPAAWMIIVAIACDIMDGRVARWTKTSSSFGVELDSLADIVSFGVAPAILMYQTVLKDLNKPGLAIAVFFVIAGALRLAKFNSKAQEGESSPDFQGLPIPAAAGMLASFVLSYELFENSGEINAKTIPLIMKRMPFFFKSIPPIMLIISVLMVSSIPYVGFKRLKLGRPKSLQVLVFVVVSVLLIVTYPQNTIFLISLIYLLSGIVGYLFRYFRLRRLRKEAQTNL